MVASANLVEIGSTAAFNTLVSRLGPQQLLVLDFHATWCGPCHAIAPIYEQLAKANPQTQFAKIDVDAQRELASYYKITAMPSFKFIKGPNKDNVVGEIRGADPRKLAQLVQDHSGPAAKFAPAAAAAPAAPQAPADVSLLPHVSATGLSCLGESKDHPLSSIVGPEAGPKGRSYLESDIDPELLISIQFNEAVNIKALSIFGGVSKCQAPKTVKLFVNQNSLDFNDAESHEAAQELTLSSDNVQGNKIELRQVRFKNVRSLHILVKDNQDGEETTRIDSLDLFGTLASA